MQETLSGYYDDETGSLILKTAGFKRTTGQYRIERNPQDPLGFVRFLNPRAVARGWATFPTNTAAQSNRDGDRLLYGSGSHPNPNRQLTGGDWEATWIGPD